MSQPAMATVTQPANSPSSSSSTSRTTNASTVNNGDTLFEPSVEMMVNDFDDERTLEEEEALAATEAEDPSAELSSLQRERDMPIEELLALYNCRDRNDEDDVAGDDASSNHRARSSSSHSSNNESEEQNSAVDNNEEDESELRKLYPETFTLSDHPRHLRTLSRPQSEEEEEDDGDYSPDEDDFKKTIMVGSEFQAVIPEGLCKYGDALPYENEDKLVWDPFKLKDHEVEQYERKSDLLAMTAAKVATAVPLDNTVSSTTSSASSLATTNKTTISTIPTGKHLRDDEQTLYLLLQCGHNVEEALRRRRINAISAVTNEMSQWSEEECRNFENGIRIYGKDFHTIQQLKVKTRSVSELVQFYYLWKKTERHDVFANKARLEKKKYSLHPGLTDYMDRFLEEQECNGGISSGSNGNNLGSTGSINMVGIGNNCTGGGGGSRSGSLIGLRDRSSSPGVNSLLYNSYRRHRNGGVSDHHQSINDPLSASENDMYSPSPSLTNNLKPKDHHHHHHHASSASGGNSASGGGGGGVTGGGVGGHSNPSTQSTTKL